MKEGGRGKTHRTFFEGNGWGGDGKCKTSSEGKLTRKEELLGCYLFLGKKGMKRGSREPRREGVVRIWKWRDCGEERRKEESSEREERRKQVSEEWKTRKILGKGKTH